MTPHEPDAHLRVEVGRFIAPPLRTLRGGVRLARGELGRTELTQHDGAQIARRGLGQRSEQVDGRDICRAVLGRAASGRSKTRDNGSVAVRFGLEQVSSYSVWFGAGTREDLGRSSVSSRPRGRWDLGVDRGTDERVHEGQPPLVTKDLSPHERLHTLNSRFVVEPCELRSAGRVYVSAQDCHRARHRGRAVTKSGEPPEHRPLHTWRADGRHVRGGLRARAELAVREVHHKLP